MLVWACVCVHISTSAHTYVRTYVRMHMYVCMYVCLCSCMQGHTSLGPTLSGWPSETKQLPIGLLLQSGTHPGVCVDEFID